MAFPSALAILSSDVSVVIEPIQTLVILRNRFSLSIYVTDVTVIIPAGEGRS
jgi:hypothetical protein